MPFSSIYKKPYAEGEINFSLPLTHVGEQEIEIVFQTGDNDIEVEIKGAYFRKTDGSGTEVQLQIDGEELVVATSGGVADTNFLSANLDRNKPDTFGLVILQTDVGDPLIVDRTGATNVFRAGGLATKGVVSYVPGLDFKYYLKKNTEYLILSTVINGAYNTSESVLYGTIRKL